MTRSKLHGLTLLFGFRLEKRVYGLLRVFDSEPFLFRSALTFCVLLRLHQVLLSSRFLRWETLVPQPGIEP